MGRRQRIHNSVLCTHPSSPLSLACLLSNLQHIFLCTLYPLLLFPFSLFFSKFRFPSDGSESTSTSSVIYNPSSSLLSSLFSPVLFVSPSYICYPSLLHQQMYYLGTCISIIHTLVLFFRSSLPYVYYSLVVPPPTQFTAPSSFGLPPITSSPSDSSLDPISLPCRFLSSIQYPFLTPSDHSDSSPLFMFSHT